MKLLSCRSCRVARHILKFKASCEIAKLQESQKFQGLLKFQNFDKVAKVQELQSCKACFKI